MARTTNTRNSGSKPKHQKVIGSEPATIEPTDGLTDPTDGNTGNTPPSTASGRTTDTNRGSDTETSVFDGENHEIPILDIPAPAAVDKPKRVRPSRAKPKSQPAEEQTLADNINIMLLTTFGVISIRAGEHWQLSPEEAEAISAPLGRIINRLIPAETSNKYTDYALLLAGVSLVVAPRVLQSKMIEEGKKNNEQTGKIVNISTKPVTTNDAAGQQTGHDNNSIKECFSSL